MISFSELEEIVALIDPATTGNRIVEVNEVYTIITKRGTSDTLDSDDSLEDKIIWAYIERVSYLDEDPIKVGIEDQLVEKGVPFEFVQYPNVSESLFTKPSESDTRILYTFSCRVYDF